MFGLIGKIKTVTGKRDALIQILNAAFQNLDGCLNHTLHKDDTDEELIWVSETWVSQAHHEACLKTEIVIQAITEGKPMIAAMDRVATTIPEKDDLAARHFNAAIDYVELPAENFDEIEMFYSTVFGWVFTPYGDGYHAFKDQKIEGGFYKSAHHSDTENGATLVVVYARDLESMQAQIEAAGGSLTKDIFSFPGGRRFQFKDPHGNELAVWSDC